MLVTIKLDFLKMLMDVKKNLVHVLDIGFKDDELLIYLPEGI